MRKIYTQQGRTMLVLTRKTDESILIGDNITIKVLGVDNGNVKLGIDAPRDVSITRSELIDAVQKANKEASNTQLDTTLLHDLIDKLKP